MKSYKDRYRRIPIELSLKPSFDDMSPDAKLVVLCMIISPRQNQAGIYDGGIRSLAYETGLDDERLNVAVAEAEKAGHIETIRGGGWWVKDTYRWQVCNEGYERAAIRLLADKWPAILPKFEAHNAGILGREDKKKDTGGSHPPSDPPHTGVGGHTGSVVQGSGVQRTDAGSGSEAERKENVVSDDLSPSRLTPLMGDGATEKVDGGNGNGAGRGNPENGKRPATAIAIIDSVEKADRAKVKNAIDLFLVGEMVRIEMMHVLGDAGVSLTAAKKFADEART